MRSPPKRTIDTPMEPPRHACVCVCVCVLVGKVGRIVKITTWSTLSDLSQPSGHPTHNKTHRRQTKQVQTEQRQTYPEHRGPRVVQLSFASLGISLQREPLGTSREGRDKEYAALPNAQLTPQWRHLDIDGDNTPSPYTWVL